MAKAKAKDSGKKLKITLETASRDIRPLLLAAVASADRMPDHYFLGLLTVEVDATITLLNNVGVLRYLRVDHVSAVILQIDTF